MTDKVLLDHLRGDQPYGVYLLDGSRTAAIVVDFDEEDPAPPLRFYRRARELGVPAYIERSKSKGWHAWIFFPPGGVQACKARGMVATILSDLGMPRIEVFPKQDALVAGRGFGNFINAPLFGRLVPKGRTVFVDPEDGFRVIGDQWSLLRSVRRVAEAFLDSEGAAAESLPQVCNRPTDRRTSQEQVSNLNRTFGLPPCARRMLADGVRQFQRVACFRLAVQLKKAGLPRDVAVACLRAWAVKNRPAAGKGIIADSEIVQQTVAAYISPCRSCGCEDPAIAPYCDPGCPLIRSRPIRAADHVAATAETTVAPTLDEETTDDKSQ